MSKTIAVRAGACPFEGVFLSARFLDEGLYSFS